MAVDFPIKLMMHFSVLIKYAALIMDIFVVEVIMFSAATL